MRKQGASPTEDPRRRRPRIARVLSFLSCVLSLHAAPAAAEVATAVPPSRDGLPAAPPWSGVSGVSPLPLTRARVSLPPVRHPAIHPLRSAAGRPLFPRAHEIQKEKRDRAAAMERHPAGKGSTARVIGVQPLAPETLGPGQRADQGPVAPCATYRVQPGDSLWSIAAAMEAGQAVSDVAELTQRIFEMNRRTIGSDPDLIHPGQSLSLPDRFRK